MADNCPARSSLQDAPVLILDEPSSALIADTELKFSARFREDSQRPDIHSYQAIVFTNVIWPTGIISLIKGKLQKPGHMMS